MFSVYEIINIDVPDNLISQMVNAEDLGITIFERHQIFNLVLYPNTIEDMSKFYLSKI